MHAFIFGLFINNVLWRIFCGFSLGFIEQFISLHYQTRIVFVRKRPCVPPRHRRRGGVLWIYLIMSLNIIVLAKQVPDTRNAGTQAMNADGTINRAALPAVFNPDDLAALEQALRIKERIDGSRVTVLTMGPTRAAELLREALYRGADDAVLLSDRAFAGADTLATSYALAAAVRKKGSYDIILCGRQAIDGDTAQVGPQVAQQLALPQLTCMKEIQSIEEGTVVAVRAIENGTEVVKAPLPLLLTVDGSHSSCRPRNVYRMLRFHRAATPQEQAAEGFRYTAQAAADGALTIKEWNLEYIGGDASQCGLAGSPTKVKAVESISFKAKESKKYTDDAEQIKSLVAELLDNHTIG